MMRVGSHGGGGVNGAEFQQLADVRTAEAQALLAAGLWDGAYYLAGYAVECAKACIAKLTKAEDFPPDRDTIAKIYSHKLAELLVVAGLKSAHDAERVKDKVFANYWSVAIGWSEQSRYARTPEKNARGLVEAVTHPTSGVLPWIKKHW
jgi:hypothetical protein